MTVATATTQTLEERVEGWANDLCRALEENYKQETIRQHKRDRARQAAKERDRAKQAAEERDRARKTEQGRQRKRETEQERQRK